jgi:hypothetical protein
MNTFVTGDKQSSQYEMNNAHNQKEGKCYPQISFFNSYQHYETNADKCYDIKNCKLQNYLIEPVDIFCYTESFKG